MSVTEPGIAVVIVNWNRRDLLLEAVESCFKSDWKNLKVIVVDNGSKDGSQAAISEKYPTSILIENNKNLGFAKGSNQGIERALAEAVDYIFFLNNDATVATDTFHRLVDLLEKKPKAGAAAPYIFYHDRPNIIWYGGGVVSFWRGSIAHRYIRRKFIPFEYIPERTDYLTGCAFLVRKSVLEKTGGFDTSLGMYSEDVDLSLRIRNAGWELWVAPDAKAFHRISASAGGELSPFKAFHRGRSNTILARRWAKWWEYPGLIFCGCIGVALFGLKLVFTGYFSTAIALISGIVNGLSGAEIPQIFQLKQETD